VQAIDVTVPRAPQHAWFATLTDAPKAIGLTLDKLVVAGSDGIWILSR